MPRVQGTTLTLTVVRGPNRGATFGVAPPAIRIGRHPEDTIVLDDITVSRHHAEIAGTHRGWQVRDLESLNGTYLNGERVELAPLRDGDLLQIGKFHLRCSVAS